MPNNETQDLIMFFTENNKLLEIKAKREELMEMRKNGMTIYQIANNIYS